MCSVVAEACGSGGCLCALVEEVGSNCVIDFLVEVEVADCGSNYCVIWRSTRVVSLSSGEANDVEGVLVESALYEDAVVDDRCGQLVVVEIRLSAGVAAESVGRRAYLVIIVGHFQNIVQLHRQAQACHARNYFPVWAFDVLVGDEHVASGTDAAVIEAHKIVAQIGSYLLAVGHLHWREGTSIMTTWSLSCRVLEFWGLNPIWLF